MASSYFVQKANIALRNATVIVSDDSNLITLSVLGQADQNSQGPSSIVIQMDQSTQVNPEDTSLLPQGDEGDSSLPCQANKHGVVDALLDSTMSTEGNDSSSFQVVVAEQQPSEQLPNSLGLPDDTLPLAPQLSSEVRYQHLHDEIPNFNNLPPSSPTISCEDNPYQAISPASSLESLAGPQIQVPSTSHSEDQVPSAQAPEPHPNPPQETPSNNMITLWVDLNRVPSERRPKLLDLSLQMKALLQGDSPMQQELSSSPSCHQGSPMGTLPPMTSPGPSTALPSTSHTDPLNPAHTPTTQADPHQPPVGTLPTSPVTHTTQQSQEIVRFKKGYLTFHHQS